MSECGVPAVCLAYRTAAALWVFIHLVDENVASLDCAISNPVAGGVGNRIVGGEISETRIEQMGRKTLRSGKRRRDGEGAGLGLGIGAKGGFRHIACAGRVPHHVDPW